MENYDVVFQHHINDIFSREQILGLIWPKEPRMKTRYSLFLCFGVTIGCGSKQPPASNASAVEETTIESPSAEAQEESSTVATPVILGALDKSLIDKTISTATSRITHCYRKDLVDNPELAGKVVYKIVIDKDGAVSKAEVKETTLQAPKAEECIANALRRLTFPAPQGGGIVIVSYPFVFDPGE